MPRQNDARSIINLSSEANFKMLGAKGQFLSTHKTLDDAEKKATSMNHSLDVFMIEDIYGGRTFTAK